MNRLKKPTLFLMMALIVLFGNLFTIKAKPGDLHQTAGLKKSQVQWIEDYVTQQMKRQKIPGMVLVIVNGKSKGPENIYLKSFGLDRISPRRPLNSELLFPLGSNRESLTALAILRLAHGQKLKLTDPVTRYLSWFKPQRKITIEQLLYHTSGIPVLPVGEGSQGGEGTPENRFRNRLTGIAIKSEPGEKYLYSPVNYDLLELIIEKVTGETYKDYLQEKVLAPFNLRDTFTVDNLPQEGNLATGYKIEFLEPHLYVVPEDAGENASDFWVTSPADLGNWLWVNLGNEDPLLQEIQRPDFYSAPQTGFFYAMGWRAHQNRRNWLFNQSSLPNYASFVAFNSSEKLGIALLANINTDIQPLTWGIVDIINNRAPVVATESGGYSGLDSMAVIAIRILIPFILVILVFYILFFKNVFQKKCRFTGLRPKMIFGFILSLVYLGGIAVCLRLLPSLLFGGASWAEIQVWISPSVKTALNLAMVAGLLFYLYYILTRLFPKPDGKNIFPTVILSIVSGFSNALIIFVINQAFNVDNSMRVYLLLFFAIGMVSYIYGQRLVRLNLIKVTADLVYSKRMEIVRKILKAHFYKLEAIKKEKILAALNNDTEKISGFINTAITGITSMVVLCCGLIYLGMINIYGLVMTLLVSLFAAASYFAAGRAANKIWEKTRDLQNVLFKFLNDMLAGFKELSLHSAKQKEFQNDLEASSANYRDNRIRFDLTFANTFVIGELMFTTVIGVIAFMFPLLFPALDSNAIRSFIFIFFYLVGPMHGILNLIPDVLQTRISWNRIKELLQDVSALTPVADSANVLTGTEPAAVADQAAVADTAAMAETSVNSGPNSPQFLLELKDVTYQYKNESGETFKVGPVNCRFQSGEITYITGGNGSGKSTLAKLITGLYHPDTGDILLDGERILPERLSRNYAAIFSDFHLFEKLYGIDYRAKAQEIEEYLQVMEIAHKVEIKDGAFSTVKLSSGQRKRLALMISFLEDRPVYLFDEWAADQDPEFRRYFYHTLLPGLKARGKCIIAITHDDRYFGTADQLVKMELGQIVEQRFQLPEETRKGTI